MDKKDLSQEILDANYATTKKAASEIVDLIFDSIKICLENGIEANIHGFGKFKITDRAERQARNPQTGEPITVPACKTVKFSPAKPLKDAVR
jgi:DNA-binding protein HU-beta